MKRMIPFLIVLICFLLTILEGTITLNVLPLLPNNWMPISHFLFMFLLLVAIFFEKPHTYYAIVLAIIFGLIEDIVYTDVIGVYLLSYTFVLYIVRVLMKFLQSNFMIAITLTICGVLTVDILLFLVYQLIQLHDMEWELYWQYRLIPTVIGNALVGCLLYMLLGSRLERWSKKKFEDTD